MINPKVSAIISTYKSEQFFEEKILDLIDQTIFNQLEIIIIDSASPENEQNIIQPYLEKYSNIKFIRTQERETIYKAWNRGIKLAKGKYVTNANTDDRLKNDAYEIMSDYLDKHENVGLIYADQFITHIPNQRFNESLKCKITKSPNFDKILQLDLALIGSQPMWRNSIHRNHNIYFDENFEVSGDHAFEIEVSFKFDIQKIDLVLGTFYRSKSTNKSYENIDRNRRELEKIRRKYTNEFIGSINNDELKVLLKRFNFAVKLPIILLLLILVVNNSIRKNNPFPSLEFIYFYHILLLKKISRNQKALKYSKKFLNRNKSNIISELNAELLKIAE